MAMELSFILMARCMRAFLRTMLRRGRGFRIFQMAPAMLAIMLLGSKMGRESIAGIMGRKFMRGSGSMERGMVVECGRGLAEIISMIYILVSGRMEKYKGLES